MLAAGHRLTVTQQGGKGRGKEGEGEGERRGGEREKLRETQRQIDREEGGEAGRRIEETACVGWVWVCAGCHLDLAMAERQSR